MSQTRGLPVSDTTRPPVAGDAAEGLVGEVAGTRAVPWNTGGERRYGPLGDGEDVVDERGRGVRQVDDPSANSPPSDAQLLAENGAVGGRGTPLALRPRGTAYFVCRRKLSQYRRSCTPQVNQVCEYRLCKLFPRARLGPYSHQPGVATRPPVWNRPGRAETEEELDCVRRRAPARTGTDARLGATPHRVKSPSFMGLEPPRAVAWRSSPTREAAPSETPLAPRAPPRSRSFSPAVDSLVNIEPGWNLV
jgi:hypothetical protein